MSEFKKHVLIEKERLEDLKSQIENSNPKLENMARVKSEMDTILQDPNLPSDKKLALFGELRKQFDNLKDLGIVSSQDTLASASAALPLSLSPTTAASSTSFAPSSSSLSVAESLAPSEANISDSLKPFEHKLNVVQAKTDETNPLRARSNSGHSIQFSQLESEICEGLDKEEKAKVSRFFKKILGAQHKLRMNKNGEVVVKGEVIPGSKFGDLANYMFKGTQLKNTKGISEFFDSLKDLKFEPKNFSNAQAVQKFESYSKGFSPVVTRTRRAITKQNSIQKGNGLGKFPTILKLYR